MVTVVNPGVASPPAYSSFFARKNAPVTSLFILLTGYNNYFTMFGKLLQPGAIFFTQNAQKVLNWRPDSAWALGGTCSALPYSLV